MSRYTKNWLTVWCTIVLVSAFTTQGVELIRADQMTEGLALVAVALMAAWCITQAGRYGHD